MDILKLAGGQQFNRREGCHALMLCHGNFLVCTFDMENKNGQRAISSLTLDIEASHEQKD